MPEASSDIPGALTEDRPSGADKERIAGNHPTRRRAPSASALQAGGSPPF